MIVAILAGDTQLYHELIRPYERSVYLMALSYIKNEADAEDVAQEALLLKAFRKPSHRVSQSGGEVQHMAYQQYYSLNEARSQLRRGNYIIRIRIFAG